MNGDGPATYELVDELRSAWLDDKTSRRNELVVDFVLVNLPRQADPVSIAFAPDLESSLTELTSSVSMKISGRW